MFETFIPTPQEQAEERRRREALLQMAERYSRPQGEQEASPPESTPGADPAAGPQDSVLRAAGRGVVNAAAEVTDTVLEVGQFAAKKTGLFGALGYSEEEQNAENPVGEFLRDLRKEHLDVEESNIFHSAVEGITQFTTGMVALSGMRLASKGKFAGTAVSLGVRGAVADFAAFDPHEKRLSNLLQDQLPENLRGLVITAAEENDPAIVGRAKQTLEGYMTGKALEGLVWGYKVIRAKKAGDAAAVEAAEKGLLESQNRGPDFDVTQTGEGQFAVTNPTGETIATAATRQEAESVASSAKYEARVGAVGMDDQLVGRIREAAKSIASEPELDLDIALKTIGDVNPIFVQNTAEAKQFTFALAQELRETMHGGRHRPDGDWGSLAKETEEYLRRSGLDDVNPETFLANVTDTVFGQAEGYVRTVRDAQAAMLAFRIQRSKAAEMMQYWANKMDLTPNDAVATRNFREMLQATADFHFYQAELGAEFGRGLNTRKIPVGAGGVLTENGEKLEPAAKGKRRVRVAQVKTASEAETIRTSAKEAQEAAAAAAEARVVRDEMKAMSKKLLEGQKGSVGVRASDFQKARMRRAVDRITASLEKLGRKAPALPEGLEDLGILARSMKVLNAAEAGKDLTREGVEAAKAGAKAATKATPSTGNPVEDLSLWLDSAESELDRALTPRIEKLRTAPGLVDADSPIGAFLKQGADEDAKLARAGRLIDRSQREGRSYMKGLTNEQLVATAKELDDLGKSGMMLSAPEMRALARQLSTLSNESELEFVLDALSSFYRKAGAPEQELAAPTTVRELWQQTPAPKANPNAGSPRLDAARQTAGKAFNFAIGYRMNALLSGPKTQVTNVLSGLINSFYLPLERGVGGVFARDGARLRESKALLGGLLHSFSDSWRMASATFKTGKDILDSFHGQRHSALPEWAKASWPLRVMQMPTRLLMTADEFFKQMTYRSMVRAQSLETAMRNGVTDPAEVLARVESDLRASFNNGMVDPSMKGSAVNPKALMYAREVTWTTPIEEGLGRDFLALVEKNPWMRLFVPFVRVPTNIMKWQFERFPLLGDLMKKNYEALQGSDPLARADAHARRAMGAFFASSAAVLSAAGMITGRGPADPELRKEWMAAGFRPYSIRIPGTDEWVSYRRVEPFASFLGLMADFRDIDSELNREQSEDAAAAMVSAAANYTFNKTYMKGLSDLFDALGSADPRKGRILVSNILGSFVPNVLNQTNPDPVMRETRTFLDEVMSRVPGFSETLEPQRNFYGEKVFKREGWFERSFNPMASAGMFRGEDKWLEDVIRLGAPVGLPPKKVNNIDLTDRSQFTRRDGKNQSPYDRWLELTGNPGNGVPPLKEALKALVTSPGWKQIPAGDGQEPGGDRLRQIRGLVRSYQKVARELMAKEYVGPGGKPLTEFLLEPNLDALTSTALPLEGAYFRQ